MQWTPPPPPDPNANTVRKNQRDLTDQEKQDFIDAIKELKNRYHPGSALSIYDEYVMAHQTMQMSIHRGSALFPWHRALTREFELELQAVNPNVTIPYWDFTVDNQPDSSFWADDFMGGDGDPDDNYIVKTGPFRQGEWVIPLELDGPDLRRHFGFFAESLPTADQLEAGMAIDTYDSFPFDEGAVLADSFRNYIAGWNWPTGEPEMHNRVHYWVGGHLAEMVAPNEPGFWPFHSFIDLIWARWQAMHGLQYPEEGALPGQNLYDSMQPFNVTPADVLDHFALGYRYDTEPDFPPHPVPGDPLTAQGLSLETVIPVGGFVPFGGGSPAPAPSPGGKVSSEISVPSEIANQAAAKFRELDENGDGFLNIYEMPKALRADWKRWDRNGDGLIDLEEYTAYFLARTRAEETPQGVAQAAPVPAWFRALAGNSNQITLAQWLAAGRSVPEFLSMDTNKDGILSLAEVQSYRARPSP